MNARDGALPGGLGECAHPGEQFGRRGGDQTGQRRGGAVPQVKRGGVDDVIGVGVGGTPAAVHVHVDKARHHSAIGEIEVGRAGGRARASKPRSAAGGLQPAGAADLAVERDGARGDHGHRPPFSQKWRMSSSWRPLVSGAYR